MSEWDEIVLAAYKVGERNSVKYSKYKNMKGFLDALERTIRVLDPDYISIRIVKPWGTPS